MIRLNTSYTLYIIITILLIAFAVRVHLLDAQSLWHDEGNSYVQATRSFSAIADNAARDIHPPGYYLLLSVWRGLTGDSEFALRSLSAFASFLSVAFAFALGKRLVGVWMGLAAAAFVALNTFSIYYAQEARMYALLAMWSSASMWAFVGLILHTKAETAGVRGHIIALALFNAAGLYTHYAFPFVMLTQGILFLFWLGFSPTPRDYRALLRLTTYYIAPNLLTLILFAPWLPTAWEQITTWPNTSDSLPTAQALSTILAWFSYGLTRDGGTTVTVAFFTLFGMLNFADKPTPRRLNWTIIVPVVWIAVTVGAFLALDLFREANLKFLLPAQIAFALLIARGMWVLWTVKVRRQNIGLLRYAPKLTAALGVFVILSGMAEGLNPLYHDDTYQRDDYRAIVATISANPRPTDAVILSAPNQQEVFDYYYDAEIPVYALPRGLGGDDAATLDSVREVITNHERIYAVLWATGERDPNGIVESTLDGEAFEADSTWYGDVRLVRYAAPVDFSDVQTVNVQFGESITLESYALSATTLASGDVLQVQLVWSTAAPLDTRYKVFVQLLAPDGFVVTQRDAEPAGGLSPTIDWTPGDIITDNHAVIIPNDLTGANFNLIIGLYDLDDPSSRLPVGEGDFLSIGQIVIQD